MSVIYQSGFKQEERGNVNISIQEQPEPTCDHPFAGPAYEAAPELHTNHAVRIGIPTMSTTSCVIS